MKQNKSWGGNAVYTVHIFDIMYNAPEYLLSADLSTLTNWKGPVAMLHACSLFSRLVKRWQLNNSIILCYYQLFSAQFFPTYSKLFSASRSIIQLSSNIPCYSQIQYILLEGGLVEGLLEADIHHADQLLQGEDNLIKNMLDVRF